MASEQNNNGQVPAPYTEGGITDLLNIIEETEPLPDEDSTMAAQGQDDLDAARLQDEDSTMAAQGEDDLDATPLPADPLRDGIHVELRKLLEASEANVRNGLAMRFALYLLIQLFRETMKDDEEKVLDKDKWLSQITTTIHDTAADNTIRYKTGAVITDALAQAPWGMDASASNTTRTINSIFDGMRSFARTLNTALHQEEQKGTILADYDVDENKSDEEEDGEFEGDATGTTAAGKKPARPQKGGDANSRDNRGNHRHAPGDTHMRTREGCRQQMDKMVGLTRAGLDKRIEAKIEELEKEIAAKALMQLSQG
ncbi:uncharacterized protein MYCFIDRAFT_84855 [Pseudocercospora fijiensis CIRAD86]|uniref:Uncharacterized protein n=1 Tax=Pseudocercospora fijiensis (strain CIRAD86) TaxID=383855 RepID=M3B178_PSEFD|nr:uncharacterized protein MYCFIDRAFT_84855 [Pseudocercospora fijiensis CIRAD86]EME83172.1 hypothetical protein MYCFIDRAFT_84855 [Pseudocercospora fijiensis CIRAD86]